MILAGKIKDCNDTRAIYSNDPNIPRCSRISWVAMTMFFFYILITPILLINLLIAIFRLCLFR